MEHNHRDGTRVFPMVNGGAGATTDVVRTVFEALKTQGYDPVEQLVGYLLSGDPTYITEQYGARGLIQQVERDEILQSLVAFFVAHQVDAGDGE